MYVARVALGQADGRVAFSVHLVPPLPTIHALTYTSRSGLEARLVKCLAQVYNGT